MFYDILPTLNSLLKAFSTPPPVPGCVIVSLKIFDLYGKNKLLFLCK